MPKLPESERDKKKTLLGQASFDEYGRIFVQRIPRYAVKGIGAKRWRTKNKPLSDKPVLSHLEGKYNVAVLGKWYPEYAILDIDNRPRKFVEEIKEKLSLDESNSMLFRSESPDCYHILIKPEYHDKPPTLNLLGDVFKEFCRMNNIEVYPQRGRPIRLPFGPYQLPLDFEFMHLDSWRERLYWFEKRDPFDLSSVKYHQPIFDFEPGPGRLVLPFNIFQEADHLLSEGLQLPASRHESQSLILFALWRKNVTKEHAVSIVWEWIQDKHNGLSKDILRSPRYVRRDIESQANFIWSKYQTSLTFPDSTHNLHHGYITKPDLPDIIEITAGSLPRMKFLYGLVKFSYPRRYRRFIPIHRDRLVQLSSDRTYLKYIGELENKGITERKTAYLAGSFAKDLRLNWKYRSSDDAVLYEGRSVDSFEDTARLLFKPDEFRQLLEKAGTLRRSRYDIVKAIWGRK
jgi:hypothetical protein